MVSFSNDTILFDERFINYGCNKVQYVDYLRHLGYQFYILGDEFAMDVLHPDSSHRTHFLDYRRRTQKPEMTIVCYDYLDHLDRSYPATSAVLPLCRMHQSPPYIIMKYRSFVCLIPLLCRIQETKLGHFVSQMTPFLCLSEEPSVYRIIESLLEIIEISEHFLLQCHRLILRIQITQMYVL